MISIEIFVEIRKMNGRGGSASPSSGGDELDRNEEGNIGTKGFEHLFTVYFLCTLLVRLTYVGTNKET